MLNEVKPAAFELIHNMIVKTKDTTYETDLSGRPLHSGKQLFMFKEGLKNLINVIVEDKDYNIQENLIELSAFVKHCGTEFGHFFSEWTTGTWGVRLSELQSLIAMNQYKLPEGLSFPKYGKDLYQFEVPQNGDINIMRVENIRFNWCLAIFTIRPQLYTVNERICHIYGWEDSTLWSTLYFHPEELPFFMKQYKQHI